MVAYRKCKCGLTPPGHGSKNDLLYVLFNLLWSIILDDEYDVATRQLRACSRTGVTCVGSDLLCQLDSWVST